MSNGDKGLDPHTQGKIKETTDQMVLGEIRLLSNKFDELSLAIRVDTPWTKFRDHVRYALNLIREIPTASRILFSLSALIITVALVANVPQEIKKKLTIASIDLALVGMMVI